MRIGSIENYSVNDDLQKAGVAVETFKSLEAMFTRLHEKQLDGIAVHSNRVDRKVKQMGLRKYDKALKTNDYYITFSKGFYQNHKELCEKLWKDSVHFEESQAGRKFLERYESLTDFPR